VGRAELVSVLGLPSARRFAPSTANSTTSSGFPRRPIGGGLLVYCRDYKCNHMIKIAPLDVDKWPDDLRLSDLEPRFVCKVCGKRGAEIRDDPTPPAVGILNR
jgi:hypothetical protein